MDTTRSDVADSLTPADAAATAASDYDWRAEICTKDFPYAVGLQFTDTNNLLTIAIKHGEVGCQTFAEIAAGLALKAQAVTRLISMRGQVGEDDESEYLNASNYVTATATEAVDFLLGLSAVFYEFSRQTDKYGPGR